MKKTIYILLISSVLLSTVVYAQVNTSKEYYIIKKGDTLWDISNNKLEDYFLWPRLWNVNPQIENPDLIYPGQRLKIPSREELMRMFPEPEGKMPVVTKPEKPVIPEVVKEIPKTQKYIVNKELYIGSGWISGEYPRIGEVVSSQDTRTIVGKTDTVYLKIFAGNTNLGDKFYVIRKVKKIKHPHTNDFLGYLINIPGVVEVVKPDSDLAKAKIIDSYREIIVGDGLFPYKELDPPVLPDSVRTPDISGYIVESYNDTELISSGDIIYLDRGENDGLMIGDIFSVLATAPVKRPIATMQVFDTKPTLSRAILLKSIQEVTRGDMWGKK